MTPVSLSDRDSIHKLLPLISDCVSAGFHTIVGTTTLELQKVDRNSCVEKRGLVKSRSCCPGAKTQELFETYCVIDVGLQQLLQLQWCIKRCRKKQSVLGKPQCFEILSTIKSYNFDTDFNNYHHDFVYLNLCVGLFAGVFLFSADKMIFWLQLVLLPLY